MRLYAHRISDSNTVNRVQSEVLTWLMQPDPTGTELPDLTDLTDFIRTPD